MRRSLLSPHTFSLTWLMIFLFFSMSDVSLARLSWEMMGAHVLMGIHSLSMGQEEIESKKDILITTLKVQRSLSCVQQSMSNI